MSGPHERAVRMLLRAYWSSAGWREEPAITPEDRAYAIEAGVMFQHASTVAHDEVVAGVRDAVVDVSARDVADAFLGSLTSRRVDLRSALGSYARRAAPAVAQLRARTQPRETGVRRLRVCAGRAAGRLERHEL
jgi:hypothetical protein